MPYPPPQPSPARGEGAHCARGEWGAPPDGNDGGIFGPDMLHLSDRKLTSGYRADHSIDQIVHRLELDRGFLIDLAGRDDLVALVVLHRSFEHRVAALHDLGLDGIGLLARGIRHGRTVG